MQTTKLREVYLVYHWQGFILSAFADESDALAYAASLGEAREEGHGGRQASVQALTVL